jgi:cell division protein FtsL
MKENRDQRKFLSRTATIAITMISIILAVSLVGVIAVQLPAVNHLNSKIAEKDNEITNLNSEISTLNSRISSLQANIVQNNATILQLNSSVENLKELINVLDSQIQDNLNIIYMNASGSLLQPTTLTQDANSSTILPLYTNLVEYSGVVVVDIESTSNTTYAQVIYNSFGVNFNQNVTAGISGKTFFPVLPRGLEIRIGNTEPTGSDPVNSTVAVLYYY